MGVAVQPAEFCLTPPPASGLRQAQDGECLRPGRERLGPAAGLPSQSLCLCSRRERCLSPRAGARCKRSACRCPRSGWKASWRAGTGRVRVHRACGGGAEQGAGPAFAEARAGRRPLVQSPSVRRPDHFPQPQGAQLPSPAIGAERLPCWGQRPRTQVNHNGVVPSCLHRTIPRPQPRLGLRSDGADSPPAPSASGSEGSLIYPLK